ncbi:MAG: response regulator, partial [Nocardioidaceae bacterium]
EAADGEQALDLCTRLRPDVAILDIRMPRMDGLSTLRELRRRLPDPTVVAVLVLTTYDADPHVDEALSDGAAGFLLKSSSYEELVAAVRAAARGEAALSPSITRRVIDSYVSHSRSAQADPDDVARVSDLTPRERQVLDQLGLGASNSEIAEALFVTEHTVKTHVSRILTKSGCRDRGQAAALARRLPLME